MEQTLLVGGWLTASQPNDMLRDRCSLALLFLPEESRVHIDGPECLTWGCYEKNPVKTGGMPCRFCQFWKKVQRKRLNATVLRTLVSNIATEARYAGERP